MVDYGREYGTICAMRSLRNSKTNQCCHLVSRIASRAFFLNDEEKPRFVVRLWRATKGPSGPLSQALAEDALNEKGNV